MSFDRLSGGFCVAVGLAVFALAPGLLRAQAPIELQVSIEEANESLFDGEYAETLRLADKGLAWTSKASNRKLLASLERDWTVEECMLHVLQAEALLLSGKRSAARSQLGRAIGQLESRRTYYHRRFGQADWFWLYSAFVHFVEGDVARPVADLGITEKYFAEKQITSTARSWGNPGKAHAAYRRAGDCLERVLALDPTPTEKVSSGLPLIANRLMLRLLVSMAKIHIHKVGEPDTDDITDAEAFLVRAEELLRNNEWWTLFIAPDALFPLSYSRLLEVEEEKKEGHGANSSETTEQTLIAIKQLWCHAINDYVTVMNHRAEAEAFKEVSDRTANPTKPWAKQNAERCFQRALQLCRAQYRAHRHPLLVETECAKARWFAIISDPTRHKKDFEDIECRRLASYARDCLFLIHKIIAQSPQDLPASHAFELRCIEYRALVNIESLHARKPVLTPDQLKHLGDRKNDVERDLELLVKKKQ